MHGRFQDLGAYLAEDVVFVGPGGKPRIEGLAAAVETYRQFMSKAKIRRFESFGHEVTMAGETAVVEYEWQMDWFVGNLEHADIGREVLVLSRRQGAWKVVWRTQVPGSR
jgi:hypothetical protein